MREFPASIPAGNASKDGNLPRLRRPRSGSIDNFVLLPYAPGKSGGSRLRCSAPQ